MDESAHSRVFRDGLLDGQVCVVSGAGSGIGRETALELARLGAAVVGCGRREEPLPARAVPLVGGLLLLSPNIFPWYAVWLTPFLAFAPSMPWTAFTGTVVLAYAFFLQQPWNVPAWARVLEFVPLALGAAWWLATRVPGRRWRSDPAAGEGGHRRLPAG